MLNSSRHHNVVFVKYELLLIVLLVIINKRLE